MSRNSQGLYTLPPGNPVVPNTLIESSWANTTMDDIAVALTGSLPRDGSAPMTGPLTLASGNPTQARHATSKAYVDQFLAFATGMPIGSVVAYASASAPPGFLKCDGQAVSRTTYADLFAAIGTTYGAGDSSTTFNVPDLRDWFIRGRSDTRPLGNKQSASFASHTHAISDPTHTHTISTSVGTQSANHTHGVSGSTGGGGDHNHIAQSAYHTSILYGSAGAYGNYGGGTPDDGATLLYTSTNGNHAHSFSATSGGESASHTHAVSASAAAAATGISLGVAGGTETVPQNVGMDYYIKAVNDAAGSPSLTGLDTSDAEMISVDVTNPVVPTLVIHSNVAFGTVKLGADGKVPLGLLPSGSQQLLGYFDASAGQTPSQVYPAIDFASGDTYIISVTGLLTVYDPVTLTASPTSVAVGSLLQYVEDSLTNPTGWYYVASASVVAASQVLFTPAAGVSATNVQDAIVEVATDLTAVEAQVLALEQDLTTLDGEVVKQTAATGAANLPSGTDAERPGTPVLGQFRYNLTGNVFEGYTPNGWGQVGGGQMYGAAPVKAVFYNSQNIGENISVVAGQNGLTAGPVTVADGFSVDVANGSVWTVV